MGRRLLISWDSGMSLRSFRLIGNGRRLNGGSKIFALGRFYSALPMRYNIIVAAIDVALVVGSFATWRIVQEILVFDMPWGSICRVSPFASLSLSRCPKQERRLQDVLDLLHWRLLLAIAAMKLDTQLARREEKDSAVGRSG
jgi:hypothetical protein